MNKARQHFYSNFLEDNSSDQTKLFNASKKLLGTGEMLCFPDHLDKTVLANDIGKCFVRRIENIRRDTDAISLSPSDLSLVPPHRQVTDITGQTLHSFDTALSVVSMTLSRTLLKSRVHWIHGQLPWSVTH